MKVARPIRESLDLNEGLGVSVVLCFSDSFRLTCCLTLFRHPFLQSIKRRNY